MTVKRNPKQAGINFWDCIVQTGRFWALLYAGSVTTLFLVSISALILDFLLIG